MNEHCEIDQAALLKRWPDFKKDTDGKKKTHIPTLAAFNLFYFWVNDIPFKPIDKKKVDEEIQDRIKLYCYAERTS
jgi:hypothetical protein